MAKEKISKSKRVRDYLESNPQARNRDVVATLSEYGVTAADVSNAKAQLKKKYSRRRPRSEAAVETGGFGGVTIEDVGATVNYVQSVGGVSKARQLLDLLEQIRRTV